MKDFMTQHEEEWALERARERRLLREHQASHHIDEEEVLKTVPPTAIDRPKGEEKDYE